MHRVQGAWNWLLLLHRIFRGRSKQTYGKDQIQNLYDIYLNEFSSSKIDLQAAEKAIKDYSDSIEIANVGQLVRIGPKHDAGYVLADLFEKPNVISGGAGKNIDFENFFACRGSIVDIYDPTVNSILTESSNITHLKSALEGNRSGQFKSTCNLQDAINYMKLKSLPHSGNYLKLDIEGFEWDLLGCKTPPIEFFDQLIIEFHDLNLLTESNFRTLYENVNKALRNSFFIISISANNWTRFINFGKSFTPLTYEVTYINNRHSKLIKSFTDSPYKKLISSNNPNRPLIYNKPFYME
jgi:hypothetical protein